MCVFILSNSFKGQADQQKAFLQESFLYFFMLFWHERCHLKKYNLKSIVGDGEPYKACDDYQTVRIG